MTRSSPETETPTGLIDKRLADLREANDIFRASSWDRCSAIERNQREISWLTKLRTVFTSALAQRPTVSPHQMACLLTILDVMRSAKRQGVGMSIWDRDINAVEAAVAALSDTSTDRQ